MRELADEAAQRYVLATHKLAEESAAVMAANMALARMENGVLPDLLTGSTQNLLVPAYNVGGARSTSGVLMDFEGVRRLAPAAFAALRERIAADGVEIPGI